MKMAYDYPLLLSEAKLCEKLVSDLKTLSDLERAVMLEMLGLTEWDFKKVKRRIRWLRARAFVRGAMVGAAAVVTVALLVPN